MSHDSTIDIEKIFRAAVRQQASDILITAGSPVIFRIHGGLVNTTTPPLDPRQTRELVYSVLRSDQIARLEKELDLDFSISVAASAPAGEGSARAPARAGPSPAAGGHPGEQRFRGNAFWQRGCLSAAFRLIPTRIPSLEELQLPPLIEELALGPQGLVLVTGPTGHGKSTTLAAMIERMNRQQRRHVITVEDPIEYLHRNQLCVIEQREVGDDTRSFGAALRHILRQDPDVILIGEMRDLETIACALTAAETGHLVLATLHTNDSVQAIDRLLDVFPPHQQGQVRAQLSLALKAVVSQRLLPSAADGTRVPIVEILLANSAVRNLIREGKTHQIYSVMETHAKEGMRTLDQALKERYFEGQIGFEQARANMRNPASLEA